MAVHQPLMPPPIPVSDGEVDYAESDGEPMAETGVHVLVIMDLYFMIETHLTGRLDVYFAANMYWYYQEGNPKARKAPDVMVIPGVARYPSRRSFMSWVEGVVPGVIFEITSRHTWDEDWIQKRALYAQLGVQEYFLFDPLQDYLEQQLLGFRLEGSAYIPLIPAEDGSLVSEVLGVRLCIDGEYLRLIDLATGQPMPHRHEIAALAAEAAQRAEHEQRRAEQERQRTEQERQRAEHERQRAEHERQRAEHERQRAEGAEAELARLRALLEKQSPANGGHS